MPDRSIIIAEARLWIGTPYCHQASLKGVGCDCLGLVRGVWRGVFGREPEIPPPYTRDWAEAHGRESLAEAAGRHMFATDLAVMRAGDVILFAFAPHMPAKHCAVLVEPDRMVHCIESHPVAEVCLVPWWRRRIRFVFAFPEL